MSGDRPEDRSVGDGGIRRGPSLSFKLLAMTALFAVTAEILVFVPSIAHFRINRLQEMVQRADLVAMALGNSPEPGRALQNSLLGAMDASAIAVRLGTMRRLVAIAEPPPGEIDLVVDLGRPDPWRWSMAALETLVSGDGRTLRVLGAPDDDGRSIDLVVSETRTRRAMLEFSLRLFAISAAILAVVTASMFLVLRHLFLQPLGRMTRAMIAFAADPEDPGRIIRPSRRGDEIGEAERRLADLQSDLAGSLAQKKRLADLGVAVSKINHDLRNMLASAQLITDRLSAIPDGTVQRFVPKLVATLDRAITYSRAVLDYGRTGEAPPERRLIALRRLVEDIAEMLGARDGGHGTTLDGAIAFEIEIPAALEIDADPDQLFRVLLNLVRNAAQAFEGDADPALVKRITVAAERHGTVVTIRVRDTGPGLPAQARDNLFRPFQGGVRRGGTGLGLAICAELVRAHGGTIEALDGGPGATFEIVIADRVIDLTRAQRRRSQS